MIICNHCGNQVPAGLARCQNCGMSLSSVANKNMGAREQDELPTWLESLRANERPAAPAGEQPGFSTADLIDDDDLPGWMRAEQAREVGESDSNKHRAIRPAAMPAPNTDAGMIGATSFSARDLIDPVSLPSWMNPGQQPPNAVPPTGASGPGDFKAYPQGAPRQYAAGDLIDRQSLPPWITSNQQVQPPSPATWQGNPPPLSPAPMNPAPPARNREGGPQPGLSASSLLDASSLPSWLREGQGGQGGQPGGPSMSAGSLIDMNALPSWLRAVDGQPQGQQAGRNVPPPYGTSPRIESARVPVRPRAEMMPPDQSEAAASVFSSVLGVASVSPQYPASPAANQQNFASAPASSGAFYGPPPASPMAAPSTFNSGQAVPPGAGLAPQPAQGTIPGSYAGNNTNVYQAGGPNAQNPYIANQGQPVPGQPPASVMQTGAFQGGQNSAAYPAGANTRPGKRSFLDTIREWFHL